MTKAKFLDGTEVEVKGINRFPMPNLADWDPNDWEITECREVLTLKGIYKSFMIADLKLKVPCECGNCDGTLVIQFVVNIDEQGMLILMSHPDGLVPFGWPVGSYTHK